MRRICVPEQRKRQGKAAGFPLPTTFRAERERSYLARHSGVPDNRTALSSGPKPRPDRLRLGKTANKFAFALGLHTLRRTSLRSDRLRLGKTANSVCFCTRLAHFAEDKPPLRQAAPRQNRKLRLLLRSACALCGRRASRLDRRRLGKTANFVCFCPRLARFAGRRASA